MVDYNNLITPEGVTRTEITGAEKTQLEADRKAFADKSADRKLAEIRNIRNSFQKFIQLGTKYHQNFYF